MFLGCNFINTGLSVPYLDESPGKKILISVVVSLNGQDSGTSDGLTQKSIGF